MSEFAFLCSIIFTLQLRFICASELPLGVHPANSVFYEPFKPFTCLDKSAVIPWDKVNDDYCDCIDGTDEPGTSACPDMKFYCANVGHEGTFIHSSFVNDMACDCCDGSDEYNGYVKCNNTCGALAKEKEELMSKLKKDIESGCQIYKEYVMKKAVELEEEEKRKAEETERLAGEEDENANQEQQTETPAKQEAPSEVDEKPVDEGQPLAEHDDQLEPPNAQDTELDGVENPSEPKEGEESFDEDGAHMAQPEDVFTPPPESFTPSPRIDYGPDNGFMMLTEPSLGCLELEEKEYVYSLCAFKEVRQRSRGAPVGSGTFLGRWREWVGHPEGSAEWSREEKLEKLPYNEMLYDGGEGCWNGPNRSVRVKVLCGAENRLVSAEEPSRCTYLMKIETPAACHHEPAKLLQLMHTEL